MVVSHLEKMREMRSKPEAAGLLFAQFLKKTEKRPILVVEGDSDPLFIQTIACQYFHDFKFFIAYGNDAVLAIYTYVKLKLSKKTDFLNKRILFFLDRDHAPYLGKSTPADERIYITDYYSIENHMACKEVLEDICNIFYGINELDHLYAEIMKKFDTLNERLIAEFMSPMVLSICARKKGHQVCFGDINIKKVFGVNVKLDLEVKYNSTDYFRDKLGISEDVVPAEELSDGIESFGSVEPMKILRGHFLMVIYVLFLENIKQFSADHNVTVKKKEIRSEDIFGLSTKGRPASLDEFFRLAAVA